MVRSAVGRDATSGGMIVDASVAAAWCFEDEASPLTEAALDEVVRTGAHVPSLWVFEMVNVLAIAERRGRVDAKRVARFLEALLALPVRIDHREADSLAPALVRLARAQQLTGYDASYLELAMRTGLPLATCDAALRASAQRLGVALFEG